MQCTCAVCYKLWYKPWSPTLCRLALACTSIALLLVFLGLWVYFVARAYRRIMQLNYADNRIANISIRIQVRHVTLSGCCV